MARTIYVVAGEVSGDIHAAELMRGMLVEDPELQFTGLGGPEMQKVSGKSIENWLDQSAVMGVVEVLKHYSFFKEKLKTTIDSIVLLQPDLLLMVDYPGFNLRLAASVKSQSPETKIAQYVCPQVWAWKKGRIPKIAACVDYLLCLFPFEPKLFEGFDIDARFVGNPLVDELEAEREAVDRTDHLVGLFPGSREKEVDKLFPMMLETARRLHCDHPHATFEVPGATPKLTEKIQKMISEAAFPDSLKIVLTDGESRSLMQRAHCGVIASGTATLEASYYGMPYCVVYKLAWSTFIIAKLVVKIKFIGIINILADREIVKELIQSEAEPAQVMLELGRFLKNPADVQLTTDELLETSKLLGETGVSVRAARTVIDWIER